MNFMRIIFHIHEPDFSIESHGAVPGYFKKTIFRKNTHGFELDAHIIEVGRSIVEVSSLHELLFVSFPDSIEKLCGFKEPLNEYKITEFLKFSESLMLQERFWESHVILENLWKLSEGNRKSYFQGLILLSASMVQYQMGRETKAYSIYQRSYELIQQSKINSKLLDHLPHRFSYPISFNFESMFPDQK